MPDPITIGGVSIYLPEKKGLFAKCRAKKALKVLPKEGEMNVVKYNGLTIKFPDQNTVNVGMKGVPAKISTQDGKTELILDRAVVTDSEGDDNIVSYCTGSIFNFTEGGRDNILQYGSLELYPETEPPRNKVNLGKNDAATIQDTFYYEGQPKFIQVEKFEKDEDGKLRRTDSTFDPVQSE